MSVNQTEATPKIASLLNQDLINSPQNKQKLLNTSHNRFASANVTLSENAAQLLSPPQSNINEEKIENIKRALREGKLVVDANKIANALINQVFQETNRHSTRR